ncbi:hypothetical protein BST81_18430 [Leptolyngbya sp. 'hensonii']|nr:hypothetical protein BST81_18430 [Leptolyngbya sp. 'hensonii']
MGATLAVSAKQRAPSTLAMVCSISRRFGHLQMEEYLKRINIAKHARPIIAICKCSCYAHHANCNVEVFLKIFEYQYTTLLFLFEYDIKGDVSAWR